MNRLLLLTCVFFTSLTWLGNVHAQALPLDPVDSIVALVEEDVILRSELDRAVATILAQYADRKQQLPPRPVLEKQVLERLVLLRLQLQRAEASGIRIGDAQVEQTVRQIAEQNRITLDQLRQQLAREGLSFDEFRQSLRDEITAQQLRQSVIQSRVNVSDTEIDILLASDSLQKGRVHLGQLVISVPDDATDTQIQTARDKAEGVRKLITDGAMQFSTAAIRYSDAPNALEGGDLGWRGYDEIPPLFASIVQGMKAGEMSPAVRGPNGFYIVHVSEIDTDNTRSITEYHARDILIQPNELTDSTQAKAKLEAIREQLLAGADFAELARAQSTNTLTRNQGGDMGWFQQFQFGERVGEQVVKLADDAISPVFQSEAGWHLIQRLGSREQDITEEVQRNRAREAIGRRKSEDEYSRFLRQLHDESYIELRLNS